MNIKIFNNIFDKMEKEDNETLLHLERTASLCYACAKELNLDSEDLEIVYLSGLLHEIGIYNMPKKVNINDECFDTDNISIFLTTAILNYFDEYSQIKNVIFQYKENIDGSGYPNKLVGEEINLLSIILRISDFYDTCRKNGFTHDESTVKLRQNSDIIFPRKIITPFIKSIIKNDLQFEYDRKED